MNMKIVISIIGERINNTTRNHFGSSFHHPSKISSNGANKSHDNIKARAFRMVVIGLLFMRAK